MGDPANPKRRQLLAGLAAASIGVPRAARARTVLRVGLTPVILDDRTGFVERLRIYLERTTARPLNFVQRRSYAEIVEKLVNGSLDAAWLCGYPFMRHRAAMELLAVPLYQGTPTYRAYIIGGPTIPQVTDFSGLRGRVFAYSDPLSNSGFLFAQDQLRAASTNDTTFFRKTFFTFSHQNVIEAVASGLADAGSCDGYVWDTLQVLAPALTAKTRILIRSQPFGFPPLVSSARAGRPVHDVLQTALLGMHQNDEGKQLLRELRLDRFIAGEPALFDGIADMMRRVGVATTKSES